MKKTTPLWIGISLLTIIAVIIPALLVIPFDKKEEIKLNESNRQSQQDSSMKKSAVNVEVYRSQKKVTETLPLEEYVAGVVSAEMPAEFEKEALKAQALTARTYIVKHMLSGSKTEGGADVTDTVQHQVYRSKDELQKSWGKDYELNSKKIAEAVNETAGEIITYDKSPITASFFSTSNGYTENSEDYWSATVPYLKSVNSPWDKQSPKYHSKVTVPLSQFEAKLGIKIDNSKEAGMINGRTSGKRIASVTIGGKEFTGREVREKLKLPSTDFSWVVKGKEVVISTKGYGHGVGMSQYGANGMAKEGKNHKQIVEYYYQQIKIDQAEQYMASLLTAKK